MATRGKHQRSITRAPASRRVAYGAAALCFTLAALAGAVAAAAATTTTVVSVSVRDYQLVPNTLTITRGTDVRFTNTGEALHRIVSDDGTLDTHPLQPGHNAVLQFPTIGVIQLHCEIHPSMTLTVNVVAVAPAAVATNSGTTRTAASQAAAPQTLPRTGSNTTALSLIGLALILVGMAFLVVGRNSMSPIPAVAAATRAATIARVMGWENRFDDLVPGRSTEVLRRRTR